MTHPRTHAGSGARVPSPTRRPASSKPSPSRARSGRSDISGEPVFLRACRRLPTPYTPIWMMRQAGRFDPAYRAVRERVPFLDLVKSPDLAAQVTVGAVERLGVDAAILFSDLLVPLEPMGLGIEYPEKGGPIIHRGITTATDVDRLAEVDAASALSYVAEAVRRARAALPASIPLIGFAGAPFTLASYAIEGGSSRTFARTKAFMYQDTGAWNALLAHLGRAVVSLVKLQVSAGAQAIQIFDSWVGCLSPSDYKTYVLPHSRALIQALPDGIPIIHFGVGTGMLLGPMRAAGSSVVGVDFTVDLDWAWSRLGRVAVQGNLDPAVLLTSPDVIRKKAREVLRRARGRAGHIFNLGHGVLPTTPMDHVKLLVDTVHAQTRR